MDTTRIRKDIDRKKSYKFRCITCGNHFNAITYISTVQGIVNVCDYNYCPYCGKKVIKNIMNKSYSV